MAQRGVPGAEVVERDSHAERAQVCQARGSALRVGEDGGLCDLQAESFGGHARLGEQRGHHQADAFVTELARRDVHGHADLAPARAPVGQLAKRRAENPRTDRRDQPVLLRERDELVGGDRPPLAVRPANERLA